MLGLGNSTTSATTLKEPVLLETDNPFLQLWLKFNTGITDSGGAISQWDDSSGNGRHAKQTVGSRKPTLSSGDVDFDGSDDRLDLDANINFGPISFFAVVDPQQATPDKESIVGSSSTNHIKIHQGSDPDRFTFRATSGNISDQTNLTEDLPSGKFLLTVIRQRGTVNNVIVRVNGSVVTHAGQDNSDVSDNFTIKTIGTSGGGLNPFDGLINEIAAFNTVADSQELVNIENDIMTRNSIS